MFILFLSFFLSLSFSASGKYAALGNGISKMCNEFDNYATETFPTPILLAHHNVMLSSSQQACYTFFEIQKTFIHL